MTRWQRQRWCSCGVTTHGNGGWTSHKRAHRRRGEWGIKHRELTRDQYAAAFPDRHTSGVLKRDLWTVIDEAQTLTPEKLRTIEEFTTQRTAKMKQKDKEFLVASLHIRLAEINLYALREAAGLAGFRDNDAAQRSAREVSDLLCKIVGDDD